MSTAENTEHHQHVMKHDAENLNPSNDQDAHESNTGQRPALAIAKQNTLAPNTRSELIVSHCDGLSRRNYQTHDKCIFPPQPDLKRNPPFSRFSLPSKGTKVLDLPVYRLEVLNENIFSFPEAIAWHRFQVNYLVPEIHIARVHLFKESRGLVKHGLCVLLWVTLN